MVKNIRQRVREMKRSSKKSTDESAEEDATMNTSEHASEGGVVSETDDDNAGTTDVGVTEDKTTETTEEAETKADEKTSQITDDEKEKATEDGEAKSPNDDDLVKTDDDPTTMTEESSKSDEAAPVPDSSTAEIKEDNPDDEGKNNKVDAGGETVEKEELKKEDTTEIVETNLATVVDSKKEDSDDVPDVTATTTAEAESKPIIVEDPYVIKDWEERVKRMLIYASGYTPREKEAEELHNLTVLLEEEGKGKKNKSPISHIIPEESYDPHPVLLKRDYILYKHDGSSAKNNDNDDSTSHGDERELILLSTGFIIAKRIPPPSDNGDDEDKNNTKGKKKKKGFFKGLVSKKEKNYDVGIAVESITSIVDRSLVPDVKKEFVDNCLTIYTTNKKQTGLMLSFPTRVSMEEWVRALSVPIIAARHRRQKADDPRGRTVPFTVGFEHGLIQTSVYSAAVMGDVDMLKRAIDRQRRHGKQDEKKMLDERDEYGYAPIHYAAMKDHTKCVQCLIDAGCQVTIPDNNDRTPFDYAEIHGGRTLGIIEKAGGTSRKDGVCIGIMERFFGPLCANASKRQEQQRALKFDEHEIIDRFTSRQIEIKIKPTSAGSTFAAVADTTTTMAAASTSHNNNSTTTQQSNSNNWFQGAGGSTAAATTAQDQTQANNNSTDNQAGGKAGAAMNEMNQAMAALHERGEKMEKVNENAANMKDNAEEYKDLAKQLREKMEKKNKTWGLF